MNIEDILGGTLKGSIDVKLEVETKDTPVTTESAIHQMALDVLNGVYGSGQARKDNIYKAVQDEVNKILKEK